ncbi:LysR family transcriptional regulator ArgP [uncultured Roseovarius sp.]|uniref:LysR family transcriptional regulator ArgP n=1 Tax=uncultured Roseovarius sp. TaxID=293344 RepID=UPI0025D76CB0|nr:LysR family transcriptional regulator ArgP [uncultured Roseovarius sp.]
MRIDPKHLTALAAILRNGSFEGAAHDLGVTQSAISQRLKALEDRIGTRLVTRGTPCTGTPTGNRLAAHADQLALLDAQLTRDLGQATPGTRLRLAVNADSLATWVLPALAQLGEHVFDLVLDDQDVSADWLRRGEVMGAITASARPVTGCDVTPLGALRYIPTASPAFIARHFPDGITPQAMARAPMMRFNEKDRLQHNWLSRHMGPGLTPPCHDIASSQGFVDAARLGLGWGLNPEALVRTEIAQGHLVPLLPGAEVDTALYWQCPRLFAEALSPLTRALREAAKSALHPLATP